ncbi:MAG: type VI secretion system-associated FHA domain protein TagH [Thalassobaculum sp.]
MRLVLDVTSFQRTLMGSAGRHVFDEEGGVIGRGRRCDWVLPDPDRFVSATHAEISFDGDRFHITDLSTNGVFVNGASAALGKGGNWPISDGDRILLGDFEIVARIEQDAEVAQATPPFRLEPMAAMPDPDGTDETADAQDDCEPDPIPPFPDPAVLAPPPSAPRLPCRRHRRDGAAGRNQPLCHQVPTPGCRRLWTPRRKRITANARHAAIRRRWKPSTTRPSPDSTWKA